MLDLDTGIHADVIADGEIHQQLNEPFITSFSASDGAREHGSRSKNEVFTTKRSILRIIFWILFSLFLVVQYNVAIDHSTSSNNLNQYTVNWCIGLWTVASRLFLKTVADCSSIVVSTIPESITCLLVIMVSVGCLESAFLVMVSSTTLLSLYVAAQSLHNLANLSPETDTITERSK